MTGPAGIIPARGQVLALRASVSAEELRSTCSWDGNDGFEYWFPRPVVGDEKPLADDSTLNDAAGRTLRKFLPAVFPRKFAEDAQPEEEWTGIMAFTKLHDPFVGPVVDKSAPDGGKFAGQYIAAGYSGHGMPRAFSCADIVASMIASDISGTPWAIPDWFPEAYLTSG
ncbi:hypothetical protein DFH06DRAFT_1300363 [Mycena polygramma]|nr:hypothetical protein DFH06DRAFT_1300363 [Mycena polygramma]